jgi:hypothetical protein
MPARTQNVYQLVLTKPIPWERIRKMHLNTMKQRIQCQRGHNKYVKMCRLNPSNASEVSESTPTCVQQTHPMPAWVLNASQLVLTKTFHASEHTNCIRTCVEQTQPMPARTRNTYLHVLTIPLICQR